MPRRERHAPEPWELRADEASPGVESSPAVPRRRGKPRGSEDKPEAAGHDLPKTPAGGHAAGPTTPDDAQQPKEEPAPDKSPAAPDGEPTRNDVASEAFGHDSIRKAYEDLGAEAFYAAKGACYVNPHSTVLNEAFACAFDAWEKEGLCPLNSVLDLACGSGEATAALEAWLQNRGAAVPGVMEAADPYTFEAFERRFPGRACQRWTFEEIAGGCLESLPTYDLVICSFALHLLDRSWLYSTLQALARQARLLIVATPHKRPIIDAQMGWQLHSEILHERVRLRLYGSLLVDELQAA